MLLTVLAGVAIFAVAVLALSLKVLAGSRTPLKEHACDVMCRHGGGHACTCRNDGTCDDYPEGHP
ncbi:MAG TPA: hypothetical protein PLC24_00990 [Myxococcota bacterium]|nr:hypothetical protein [Myxococcota bacterium]